MTENKYSLGKFMKPLTQHETEQVKSRVREQLEHDVKVGKITVDQMNESWSKILKIINGK